MECRRIRKELKTVVNSREMDDDGRFALVVLRALQCDEGIFIFLGPVEGVLTTTVREHSLGWAGAEETRTEFRNQEGLIESEMFYVCQLYFANCMIRERKIWLLTKHTRETALTRQENNHMDEQKSLRDDKDVV